jgi:hypothetical protein
MGRQHTKQLSSTENEENNMFSRCLLLDYYYIFLFLRISRIDRCVGAKYEAIT